MGRYLWVTQYVFKEKVKKTVKRNLISLAKTNFYLNEQRKKKSHP
jgi:hypothetical protein